MRVLIVLSTILLLSCNGLKKVRDVFKSNTPYEEYKSLLEKAEFKKTALARQWIKAGEDALHDSLSVSLPHVETGYFQASRPDAHSYQFQVKGGQKLKVSLEAVKNDKNSTLFVDLFESDDSQWEQIAYGDSSNNLEHEFKKSRLCLLRIQPELLTDFYYTVKISVSPLFSNPVSGASNQSIQSIFGDPRDGGLRSHEGIDIFASRGTPVVAPANGVITRVGDTNLGGKVIWMRDTKRNLNYYFAHLDRQIVNAGKMVKQGDTLGLVGNTGNARYTTPHLHFGIYQYGAINPLGYIQTVDNNIEKVAIDTSVLGKPFKIVNQKVHFRKGPGTKYGIESELKEHTFLTISGESHDWYRAQLPDKQEGYIYKSLIKPIAAGQEINLTAGVAVLSDPDSSTVPKMHLKASDSVELLAVYKSFEYIRTIHNITGWVHTSFVGTQKAIKR